MATKNRDRKEVQQLIEMGKSKGFLTYDEVNDALPADMVAADQIDDVIGALGDEDIEIVDAATQVKIAPKRIADEEAAEKKTVPRRALRDAKKTTRRLLLEVERPGPHVPPQDGERLAPHARGRGRDRQAHRGGRARGPRRHPQLARSPSARSSISATSSGSTRSASRTSSATPRTTNARVRRGGGGPPHHPPHRQGEAPRQGRPGPHRGARRRAPQSRKKGIEAEIEANRTKMVETLEEMRLNKKTIDKIVTKLRALIQKVERAESGVDRAREAHRRRHGRSSARRRAPPRATSARERKFKRKSRRHAGRGSREPLGARRRT